VIENDASQVKSQPETSKNPPLKRKQLAFCREYIKDWNGTQAAIRAGYSKDTANEQASQLLAKLSIRKEIDSMVSKIMDDEKAEIKARVIEELRKIGFNDAERDDIYNKDGELVAVSRRDRIKSLELLGKYGALFTERIAVTDNNGGPFGVLLLSREEAQARLNELRAKQDAE